METNKPGTKGIQDSFQLIEESANETNHLLLDVKKLLDNEQEDVLYSAVNNLLRKNKEVETSIYAFKTQLDNSKGNTPDDNIDCNYYDFSDVIDEPKQDEAEESCYANTTDGYDDDDNNNNTSNVFTEDENSEIEQEEKVHNNQLSDWDVKFRNLLLCKNSEKQEIGMSNLSDNFCAAAASYTRMIVAEQHVNSREKKIQPLDVGGVAGGTKFAIHGLFFKYPIDTLVDKVRNKWLYGGNNSDDNVAAKASNHDFNGLSNFFFAIEDNEFNVPLMALVDYQGFRLSVMTTLPIHKQSLVYGSNDAGKSMANDQIVHAKLDKIGRKLCLCKHLTTTQKIEMALCGDIEIHEIKGITDDVLYYALDMARLFPPASSENPSPPGGIFYRMLRPELLQAFTKSTGILLSSDALSAWQKHDPNSSIMDSDICRATEFLLKQVEECATHYANEEMNHYFIGSSLNSVKIPSFGSITPTENIIQDLHFKGINIRYIGRLVLNLGDKNPDLRSFLTGIMILRSIKNQWRNNIRQSKKNGQRIHKVCLKWTIKYLSLILSINKPNTSFWKETDTIDMCLQMFGKGILDKSSIQTLNKCLSKELSLNIKKFLPPWIVIKFCQLCGVVLSNNSVRSLNERWDSFSFSKPDIVDFVTIIKTHPILDYFTGLYYLKLARKEVQVPSKSSLMAAALLKIHRVVGYQLPNIMSIFAEVQFETLKFNKNIEGNWDNIISCYYKQWQESNFEEGTKIFWDFLCSILWRPFRRQLFQHKNRFDKIPLYSNINQTERKKIAATPSSLNFVEASEQFVRFTEKIENTYSNEMKSIVKGFFSVEITNDLVSQKMDVQELSETKKKALQLLIEEVNYWEIDGTMKAWFFEEFFDFEDLIVFCKNNAISLYDEVNKKFLLCESPLTRAMAYPDCLHDVTNFDFLRNTVKDEIFTKTILLKIKGPALNAGCTSLFSLMVEKTGSIIKRECSDADNVLECLKCMDIPVGEFVTLDLRNRQLGAGDALLLSETIKNHSTLKELILRGNNIKKEGEIALANAMKSNSTLTKLDLDGNNIENEGVIALANALTNNSTLTYLWLGGNNIKNEGVIALADALKSNSTLVYLWLDSNNIENEGAIALSEALKSNSTLTKLDLGNNDIQEGAIALADGLKSNTTLISLDLNGNKISDNGVKALSESLKSNAALTFLNLKSNKIGKEGAIALTESLKSNSTLTTLELSSNTIEKGAIALADALKSNSTLTKFDLGFNNLEKEGAIAMAEALKSNSTLITLDFGNDFGGNKIGDEGTIAMADALKSNSTLTELGLYRTDIRNDGAKALSEALKSNSTLKKLDLNGNNIESVGAITLSEALKRNFTLTDLNLWNNNVDAIGAIAMADALKSNSALTLLTLVKNKIDDLGKAAFENVSTTCKVDL